MRTLLQIVLPALGAAALVMGAFFFGTCENTRLATLPAPSGGRKAVVFARSCGATTGFSTQVSLLRHLPLGGGGNVFVADTDQGKAPSGAEGGPQVRVRWSSPDTLRIAYDARARVFRAERLQHGVTIVYEPWAPAGAP